LQNREYQRSNLATFRAQRKTTAPAVSDQAIRQSCVLCQLRFAPIKIKRPTESGADMSERLETLIKARERMADDRDAFAKTLAAPFDRDKAERARIKFIETQVLIDAIDRAIEGEPSEAA
jgi:hypothetical protein